jgi:hypothetical protein
MGTNETDRALAPRAAPSEVPGGAPFEDDSPFEMGELEEIDAPLLPWRKRKPVERRRPARGAEGDQAG